MGTQHSNYAVTQGSKAKVNYRAIFGLPPLDKAAMLVANSIRHLHLSHSAPYLLRPPPSPPKNGITFVVHLSWVLQPSQEKFKTMLRKIWGGK